MTKRNEHPGWARERSSPRWNSEGAYAPRGDTHNTVGLPGAREPRVRSSKLFCEPEIIQNLNSSIKNKKGML